MIEGITIICKGNAKFRGIVAEISKQITNDIAARIRSSGWNHRTRNAVFLRFGTSLDTLFMTLRSYPDLVRFGNIRTCYLLPISSSPFSCTANKILDHWKCIPDAPNCRLVPGSFDFIYSFGQVNSFSLNSSVHLICRASSTSISVRFVTTLIIFFVFFRSLLKTLSFALLHSTKSLSDIYFNNSIEVISYFEATRHTGQESKYSWVSNFIQSRAPNLYFSAVERWYKKTLWNWLQTCIKKNTKHSEKSL